MFSSLFISLDPAALLLLEGLVSVAKVVGVVAAVELVPVQHGLEAGASAVGARVEEGWWEDNLKSNNFCGFLVRKRMQDNHIFLHFQCDKAISVGTRTD